MEDLSKHEKAVSAYVDKGQTDKAVKLLFKLIAAYAKRKNFIKAEALREQLFDVDSMALNEIIKSAEIIESEKSDVMDHDHMKIWSNLYDSMNTEEANTLYFALKKEEIDTDEQLFIQGKQNSRLYLINEGQLKLTYSKGGTETLISTVSAGDIAGEDTFFSITMCTSTLTSMTPTQFNYLEKSIWSKWQKEMPTLASKLESFCRKHGKIGNIFHKQGVNRRAFKRVPVGGTLLFQVLNAKGKPIGRAFKGDLSDISQGGLSFYIKTANRKNALMLLGRNLNVEFTLPLTHEKMKFRQSGRITGVINQLFSDYSIHMKFNKGIGKLILDQLEQVPEENRMTKTRRSDKSAF